MNGAKHVRLGWRVILKIIDTHSLSDWIRLAVERKPT